MRSLVCRLWLSRSACCALARLSMRRPATQTGGIVSLMRDGVFSRIIAFDTPASGEVIYGFIPSRVSYSLWQSPDGTSMMEFEASGVLGACFWEDSCTVAELFWTPRVNANGDRLCTLHAASLPGFSPEKFPGRELFTAIAFPNNFPTLPEPIGRAPRVRPPPCISKQTRAGWRGRASDWT